MLLWDVNYCSDDLWQSVCLLSILAACPGGDDCTVREGNL